MRAPAEAWRRAIKKHPTLPDRVREGTPLRIVLAEAGLDSGLEPYASARPEVVAARAGFERTLLERVEKSNDAGALTRLEREFGYRKPSPRTSAEEFGEQLSLFAEWCQRNPEARAAACYERLYQIVAQGALTSTQKRAKHRSEGIE